MDDVYFKVKFDYDRKALAKIVYELDHDNKWDGYLPPTWDTSKYTVNNFTAVTYRYYPELQDMEPIRAIREQLNFSYLDYMSTQLVKFPPWNGPTLHRDVERETALLIPIYTFEKYEPVNFYKDKDKSFWFDVDYADSMIVFNAKMLHGCANKEFNRYSLQFDIRESYAEVYEKYKKGELFKC